MKRVPEWLSVFFLPVATIVTWWLLLVNRSFFWLSFDPDYPYLFNGLNFARYLGDLWHVDHPGTPVQMFVGVVIKIAYNLKWNVADPLPIDVVKNPEWYLLIANIVIIFTIVASLAITGYFVFRFTESRFSMFLFQAAPFFSHTLLKHALIRVKPEPFLFLFSIWIGFVLVYIWTHAEWAMSRIDLVFGARVAQKKISRLPPITRSSIPFFAGVLGAVIGVGIATKINYLPLVFLPVFFPLIPSYLVTYGGALLSSFWLATFPIHDKFPFLKNWVVGLIFHTETYGHGELGVIDQNTILPNFLIIIRQDPIYAFVLSFLFLIIGLQLLQKRKFFPSLSTTQRKILIGLALVHAIGIMMNVKHSNGSNHYILPGLSLTATTALFCFLTVQKSLTPMLSRVNSVITGSIFLVVIIGISFLTWKQMEPYLCDNRSAVELWESQIQAMTPSERQEKTREKLKTYIDFGDLWSGYRNSDAVTEVYRKYE